MDSVVVIADDFTGASDTGVQLTKNGIAAKVFLDATSIEGTERGIVIDTESRVIGESEAASRVQTAVRAVLAHGEPKILYKKIDSTLRGHLAAEIRACIEAYQPDTIVFAPSYLEQGRTVEGARLYVNGTALLATEIARDPRNPLTEDNISRILAAAIEGTKFSTVEHIGVDELATNEFITAPLEARAYTFDAVDADDLADIARVALNTAGKVLYIGSAGLAGALIKELGPSEHSSTPSLAIVGSISTKTMAQIAYARAHGTKIVHIDMARAYDGESLNGYINDARELLAGGNDVIVTATETRANYESFVAYGMCRGASIDELAALTKETLASLAPKIIAGTTLAGVFLTGGDTAIAVIEVLGAAGSAIECELIPGFVAGRLVGGTYAGLPIVTKAGAFGTEADIYKSLQELKRL